jgi:ferrous iron transport protein A
MANLAELNENESAVVLKVKAAGELKQRLASLGLRKNANIKVKTHSLNKSTIEIEIGTGMIALRREEAREIEVQRV